jgi:hypothetical protein
MTVCTSYDGYRLTISSFATAGRTTVCVETFELELGPACDSLTLHRAPCKFRFKDLACLQWAKFPAERVASACFSFGHPARQWRNSRLSAVFSDKVHSPLHQLEHFSLSLASLILCDSLNSNCCHHLVSHALHIDQSTWDGPPVSQE